MVPGADADPGIVDDDADAPAAPSMSTELLLEVIVVK